MTLEQLKVLAKVVEAGSFTRAADVLGMQRSNVSRTIAQLEAELEVTLLERSTRTQSVTEAGREVYERAVGVLAAVEDTVRVTQQVREEPRGVLRVTCGVEFGMGAVGDWIEAYLERYPHVQVEAEYGTREIDLVHEGFDLGIRAGPLPESRLAARKLGDLRYGFFASPQYVKRRGMPRVPGELSAHDLVVFTGEGRQPTWTMQKAGQRQQLRINGAARFRVNAGAGVRNALIKGIGVGPLPLVIADELVREGRLV